MAPPPPLFHSLLRPCVLQILRAQGYYAARTSVVDSLTDMAARYLLALCEATALHASHNSTALTGLVPTVVDVRLAFEDCGTLVPPSTFEGPAWPGSDTRSVDEFIEWVCGPRNREIQRVALDGDDENSDYLSVLKKKHSKTGEDSKYSGTILGRGNEHGDVVVEGGEFASILSWQEKRLQDREQPPATPLPGEETEGRRSRSASSGLSSVDAQSMEDMELEFTADADVPGEAGPTEIKMEEVEVDAVIAP